MIGALKDLFIIESESARRNVDLALFIDEHTSVDRKLYLFEIK